MHAPGMIVPYRNPRGLVRQRSASPDFSRREVIREEAGGAKKVQVVESDTLQTRARLWRRDEEISELKDLVRKKINP